MPVLFDPRTKLYYTQPTTQLYLSLFPLSIMILIWLSNFNYWVIAHPIEAYSKRMNLQRFVGHFKENCQDQLKIARYKVNLNMFIQNDSMKHMLTWFHLGSKVISRRSQNRAKMISEHMPKNMLRLFHMGVQSHG